MALTNWYMLEALFATVRISVWFVLLFGFLAPLFLDYTRQLPAIEKLIYSWVGLGGVIIFAVFILTLLHIYDFISLTLTLLLIPLIWNIWNRGPQTVLQYLKNFEVRTITAHVRLIERFEGLKQAVAKMRAKLKDQAVRSRLSLGSVIVTIALIGGLIRMYPAITNAAPFSRSWFIQLDKIKNLTLQDYFSGHPDPAGMHSLVNLFSMFTQVSPEMILHLLGALSSFFLCIIIYWIIKDITRNEYPVASIFGMSVYAVAPMLFMPLSLDQQIEANSIDLALCFAIPTAAIFVRNIRGRYKSPWFYVLSGFVATGMTNLFVAFIILLPLMVLGLLSLPRRRYFRSFLKVGSYLVLISVIVLLPVVTYCLIKNIDLLPFFLEQFFSTGTFSFYPFLILPIEELSMVYISIAATLLAGYLLEKVLKKEKNIRDECIFLIIFISIALVYTPYIQLELLWIDSDQLNAFYALLIAVLGGVMFSGILRWSVMLFRIRKSVIKKISIAMLAVGLTTALYAQGGIKVSRQLPSTVPNGFLQAYYAIIGSHMPYSYATVGPEISRITAKNRHYFMNYDYFLNKYGSIDSLYHEQLLVPAAQRDMKEVPPASIFVFLEKPPYGSIQQGILYDSPLVMRDLSQWLDAFDKMENRNLSVFYEDEHTKVYEIINRPGESKVYDILLNVFPGNRMRGDAVD